MGRASEAEEMYERALSIYSANGIRSGEASALEGLLEIYQAMGNAKCKMGSHQIKLFAHRQLSSMSRRFRVLGLPFLPQNGLFKKISHSE